MAQAPATAVVISTYEDQVKSAKPARACQPAASQQTSTHQTKGQARGPALLLVRERSCRFALFAGHDDLQVGSQEVSIQSNYGYTPLLGKSVGKAITQVQRES